ncbi:MAG: proline--tRNA ligase [Methanoculleaceae archaeon]
MGDDGLPPRENFSEWYNEILWRAEIMDVRYPVKGLYVWYPFGFKLRTQTYQILRNLLDKDHEEALFPLLIPEYEFMKEAEHIRGFEDEVYWVTHGGKDPLEVPLALRPTSETAIYPMYALWVRSHADLPIRIYQIVNTFRYETKHTRPLIRLREITSFKEAHTVHATWEEAEEQVETAVERYKSFYEQLCVPIIFSRRPDWDRFPGADYTMAADTVMPDGRTLQVATVHHLSDNFSRTFGITYEDRNGEQQYAHQTCYGISERCIAAVIGIHGDDRGLVLPPAVAPVQVVIVPIIITGRGGEVREAAEEIRNMLEGCGIRVKVDDREIRPGAKYYHWEMRGVPLRLEIGPRDLDRGEVVAVTRYGKKTAVPIDGCPDAIPRLLDEFTVEVRERAVTSVGARIRRADTLEEAAEIVQNGCAIVPWCGSTSCAEIIEKETGASLLGTDIRSDFVDLRPGRCVVCKVEGVPALLGRSY